MKKSGIFLLWVSLMFLAACHSGTGKAGKKEPVSKVKNKHPLVVMQTRFGKIVAELYPEKAPVTVANFEKYIKTGKYRKAMFYRAVTLKNQPKKKVKIEVIQGGLFQDIKDMMPPIKLETTKQTGLHHLNGTLSMARNDPNSATSEFFICIGKQPSLDYGGKRNPDGQGFAAFGRVIRGMDVVKKIQQQPTDHQLLVPPVKIDTMYLVSNKSQ